MKSPRTALDNYEHHYKEAEADIEYANNQPFDNANFWLARAQVHATLATAAAVILNGTMR